MHRLLPEEQFHDYQLPAPSIPDSIGHHREWVEAIKNGGATTCSFDYSGALSEAVLLGNLAYRLEQEVLWDAASLRPTNLRHGQAEPLIRPGYRGSWRLQPG